MRKTIALTLLSLAVLGGLIAFRLTHHPVYGNCHTTDMGTSCTLKTWERNQ